MRDVAYNAIANFLGKFWAAALSLIFLPFYLKFLGAEAYGLVGLYSSIQAIFGLLDFGIGSTITREIAGLSAVDFENKQQRNLINTFELVYWFLALMGGVIIFCFSGSIGDNWLKSHDLTSQDIGVALKYMALAFILQFPISYYQSALNGLEQQATVNIVMAAVGTFRAIGSFLMLWLISPTVNTFIFVQIAASIGNIFLLRRSLQKLLPVCDVGQRFDISIIKRHLGYSITTSASAIIGVLLTQLDKVILSHIVELKQFSYYVFATSIASVVWIPVVAINYAVFPRFAKFHKLKNYNLILKLLHNSSQLMSFLIIPFIIFLAFNAHFVIFKWTNNDELSRNTSYLVAMLLIGNLINGVSAIPIVAANAMGQPQLLLKTQIIQALISLPLMTFLTYCYHSSGAATGWIILNCVYLLWTVPIFFKHNFTKEKWQWLIYDFLFPLCFSLISIMFLKSFLLKVTSFNFSSNFGIVLQIVFIYFITGLSLKIIRSIIRGFIFKILNKVKAAFLL